MTDPRWERTKDLVDAALDLPAGEREAYLDDACAADAELRAEVASLLESHEEATGVWERVLPANGRDEDPRRLVGRTVAGYGLEAYLRSGGTSHVYRAVRVEGDGPRVCAVKVLRVGLCSGGDVLGRFARERRILGHLRHPGIVRLIDADVVDERPCLLMELVEGRPIDRHVAEARPSLAELVRLVASVCDAVQYAHGNLVVHRDLKPGNLLVTAAGEPKILDFGIVKLLAPGADDTDVLEERDGPITVDGLAPLTPRYASPEQLSGEPVTTASDVYALGVLLHELLEPYALPAAHDLRAIADKARSAGPADRYASAAGLADDLRRFLVGEPVSARRATWAYRTRRFLARHRWSAALTAVLIGLLLSALVSLDAQRDRAVVAEVVAWRAHGQALAVSRFYQRLLEASDPAVVSGDAGLMLALEAALADVGERFAGHPEAEGRVRVSLAHLLDHLGRRDEAAAQVRLAIEIARDDVGFDATEIEAMERYLASIGAS